MAAASPEAASPAAVVKVAVARRVAVDNPVDSAAVVAAVETANASLSYLQR